MGVASRAGLLPAAVAQPAGPAGRGWPGGGCRPAPRHGWHHDRSARARPAALRPGPAGGSRTHRLLIAPFTAFRSASRTVPCPGPAGGSGTHRLLTAFFAAFRSARGTAPRPAPAGGADTDRPITDLHKAPRTALRSALRTAPRPQPPPHLHPISRARPSRPNSGRRSASQPPTQSLPQPPLRPPPRRASRPRCLHSGAGARRVAHHGR